MRIKKEHALDAALAKPDYLVVTGSRLYGSNTPDSDQDERGFIVPPFEYIIGLGRFDQRVELEPVDRVLFSVQRLFALLRRADPQAYELLWVPKDKILRMSEVGRHPKDRKRMSIRTESGRIALTHWRVLTRYPAAGLSQLEIRPETGRTHQIRVHLSSAGMPLAGDPVYGRSRDKHRGHGFRIELERPALHAARLAFSHPRTGERLDFTAPLPEDLAAFERALADFGSGSEAT